MSIHKTDAIVLKKRPFRETSLIVDFFSRDFGKMSGLLKGIRTEPKKFASTVEPFSHNEVIFYRKQNSSLHLVSHCDERNGFHGVRSDIGRIGIGSFMMELVDAVMPPEDKNDALFDLTIDCLQELASTYTPEKIGTIFKIKALALSGFKPHFDSCVSCQERILGQSKFSLSRGGLLCPRCYHKDTGSRAIFRGTIASIIYIEKSDFRTNLKLGMNPQIKKELDIILNAFLSFHLERELKSEKVLQKLEVGV